MPGAYFASPVDQPHPARTRAILEAHPEVRALMGRNPWTAAILAGVVSFQIAMAALMGWLGLSHWLVALLAAYAIGAFANHCLYVIVHDAAHKLIFRSRTANNIAAILADLPNLVPGGIGFGICHLAHHAHQGDYGLDADLASDWEARLIGNRWYAKALWLLVFPLFQLTRPVRLKGFSVLTPWSVANLAAAIVFDIAVWQLLGPNAIVYLGASLLFSIGLHPLGSRWIQEHFTLDPAQETGSYYGFMNRLALNVGYHNEHHDFPSVPWNRLPKIQRMAPEFYDSLVPSACWSRLWLTFICDSRYSLYSRVIRAKSG